MKEEDEQILKMEWIWRVIANKHKRETEFPGKFFSVSIGVNLCCQHGYQQIDNFVDTNIRCLKIKSKFYPQRWRNLHSHVIISHYKHIIISCCLLHIKVINIPNLIEKISNWFYCNNKNIFFQLCRLMNVKLYF